MSELDQKTIVADLVRCFGEMNSRLWDLQERVEGMQKQLDSQVRGDQRDYFASHALIAMAASYQPKAAASWAYDYADAMLAKREKVKDEQI